MIKVIVIDDSALIRQLLTGLLESDPDIKVVATAQDPHVARDKIKEFSPDVLTLDVEMPRMDGITFLANLMRLHPMPVIMVSSLTAAGADVTLKALELGAVDFVTKPKIDIASGLEHYRDEIVFKVKSAARAQIRVARAASEKKAIPSGLGRFKTTDKIIAIGASTGGTEAIRELLEQLPPDVPGVVIAQHIPEMFSGRFAARLNQSCALTVSEAKHGVQVLPGHAYVAPGNAHLLLARDGARYICHLSDAEPVNRHRPSVDVLFNSVADVAGNNAVGTILTGMGADGARGLRHMRDAGAFTMAQDEASSVVWGMPGEAVKLDAACRILDLKQMAATIIKHFTTELQS